MNQIKCTICGKPKPESGFYKSHGIRMSKQCKLCTIEKRKTYRRKLCAKHTDEMLARLKLEHPFKTCSRCKETKAITEFNIDRQNFDGHDNYCKACHRIEMKKCRAKRLSNASPEQLEQWRLRTNERNRQHKITVLTHYSIADYPLCANPYNIHNEEITDVDILTLDHINGDGYKEKGANGRRPGSFPLYRRLKRQGYPEGYQVLCANCQMKKVMIKGEHQRHDMRPHSPIRSKP